MATTITTTTVTTTTTTTVEADRKETTAAATTHKVSEQIKEESCRSFFNGFFRTKTGLKTFYPNGATEEHIKKAAVMANELLSERLGCPSREAAICLSVLQFYDLVLFVDDSISMLIEQNGERIEALRVALRAIARIYSLARPEGICDLRFLNYPNKFKNVTFGKVNGIIRKHVFRGQTRLGTEMKRKVLQEWVKDDMKRPVVVITITDGDIDGEDGNTLFSVIKECIEGLQSKNGVDGAHAVGFQFARVGNDEGAESLLARLDDHKIIGPYVDQLHAPIDGIQKDDQKWLLLPKLLLGAIDDWYDITDEAEKANDTLDFEQKPNGGEAAEEEIVDEGEDDDYKD